MVVWLKDNNLGRFESNDDANYVEYVTNNVTFTFELTSRDDQFVILYDRQRNLSVRLSNTSGEWGSGQEPQQWNFLFNGRWLDQEDRQVPLESGILTIRTVHSSLGSLSVDTNMTVADLKRLIDSRFNIPEAHQILVHHGRQLHDPSTLGQSDIFSPPVVFVVLSTRPVQSVHSSQPPLSGNTFRSTTSSATPSSPTTAQSSTTERQCRICFSGESEGHLFSPCLCRGTMQYVHLGCLNSWRQSSVNPNSMTRCDQCGHQYHVIKTQFASFLQRSDLIMFVSLVLLVLMIVGTGLVSRMLGLRIEEQFYQAVVWVPFWRTVHNPNIDWRPLQPVFDTLIAGGVTCGLAGAAVAFYLKYQQDQQQFMNALLPTVVFNACCVGYPIMRLVAAIGLYLSWKHGLYLMVENKAKEWLLRWGEVLVEVRNE
eukprot:c7698_g1_i1.p1 GENE.c7698_g1_i1~~c7698_g1_i1.p1  ORF type:complete len:426 (+),score=74.05 c7698_g1_i1:42-1319(+)